MDSGAVGGRLYHVIDMGFDCIGFAGHRLIEAAAPYQIWLSDCSGSRFSHSAYRNLGAQREPYRRNPDVFIDQMDFRLPDSGRIL